MKGCVEVLPNAPDYLTLPCSKNITLYLLTASSVSTCDFTYKFNIFFLVFISWANKKIKRKTTLRKEKKKEINIIISNYKFSVQKATNEKKNR